jgi:fumarate hydratase, class II
MSNRIEKDSFGEVQIPANRMWGAQTERAVHNFKIGENRMPLGIIYALALAKKAAAYSNCDCGVLSPGKRDLIATCCDEIIAGKWDSEFPLRIWQTGSGTQTNMNVNEVISNRAEMIKNGEIAGLTRFIHPNDDVNKSQSTNDIFPTAMRIAVAKTLIDKTLPALEALRDIFEEKSQIFRDIVKIGRTHLMDATPLTLGQEFSAYVSQMQHSIDLLHFAMEHAMELPIGGTAVGTGLNTPDGYDEKAVAYINQFTGERFTLCENKFEAMASHDSLVEVSGALKKTAVSLMKIANDMRLLGSGPRCGIGELVLPANEPGSSIMPGKVNPTQCEALSMVCCQIIGNDVAITSGAFQGHLQLNVFMPLIGSNLMNSAELMADAVCSFRQHCMVGVQPNQERIAEHLENSLMLVTALNPLIGYAKSAEIAQYAFEHGLTLKEAALKLQFVSEADFDQYVVAEKMCKK